MTQPSSRKVKVGVVGCGVAATAYYLPYLMKMDTTELVAVCDRFKYHQSTQHLIDCILEERPPLVNVDWGLHITEMMAGAAESYATGQRYRMTTKLDY